MKSGVRLESPKSDTSKESSHPDPIIHFLDEFETMLAFDASAAPRSDNFRDIDDAFFEHGVEDLQLLQASQKRTLRDVSGDAPLMTAKMRAAAKESEKTGDAAEI
ncbi:Uncharacterized protein FKW44_004067 [Caligus rogercresseyi]|uniref:Uncharacterized protein n=1 Tax=Caligus rogercresseyi TaxID=217165 RepID=A0A7T8KAF2_CALRO|nr:Uncharacterized protein FKW44_004067 [Caligus rogercresseyi]